MAVRILHDRLAWDTRFLPASAAAARDSYRACRRPYRPRSPCLDALARTPICRFCTQTPRPRTRPSPPRSDFGYISW
uniref:Uncharacterized protein n=1 Tax=Arundo donax TaxID=35708 RepID=A0A0A9EHU0_ARUDO